MTAPWSLTAIVWITSDRRPGCPRDGSDRVIDGSRLIAIPGLIDAHNHSPANIFRGLMPARPLEIWRAYWPRRPAGLRR